MRTVDIVAFEGEDRNEIMLVIYECVPVDWYYICMLFSLNYVITMIKESLMFWCIPGMPDLVIYVVKTIVYEWKCDCIIN